MAVYSLRKGLSYDHHKILTSEMYVHTRPGNGWPAYSIFDNCAPQYSTPALGLESMNNFHDHTIQSFLQKKELSFFLHKMELPFLQKTWKDMILENKLTL